MADDSSSAVAHPVRFILIAVFLPAFALCIAHGVLSSHAAPAVGLVPLAVSAASAALLLRLRPVVEEDDDDTTAGDDGSKLSWQQQVTNPVGVFVFDTVLAAALMIVLVFTWISHGGSASLSMLAAYATIPLLTSFFVHVLLALHALYYGLAVRGVFQWVAWRALPPDCPSCSTRLRPSLPEFPWLKLFRRRASAGDDYAPVFADDADRYRDDVDVENGPVETSTPQPEAVEVRKKDRKGKGTPAPPAEEVAPWGT